MKTQTKIKKIKNNLPPKTLYMSYFQTVEKQRKNVLKPVRGRITPCMESNKDESDKDLLGETMQVRE